MPAVVPHGLLSGIEYPETSVSTLIGGRLYAYSRHWVDSERGGVMFLPSHVQIHLDVADTFRTTNAHASLCVYNMHRFDSGELKS